MEENCSYKGIVYQIQGVTSVALKAIMALEPGG